MGANCACGSEAEHPPRRADTYFRNGLANSSCVLQHRLEYRLQLAGRTRDDLAAPPRSRSAAPAPRIVASASPRRMDGGPECCAAGLYPPCRQLWHAPSLRPAPQIGWPYPIGSGEYFGRGRPDVRYGLPAQPVDATQAFMSPRPSRFASQRLSENPEFPARLVAHSFLGAPHWGDSGGVAKHACATDYRGISGGVANVLGCFLLHA